jgi:CDP-diglyceride synthetase
MSTIKNIGKLIRNNIILISASLALVASMALGVYLNELPPIIRALAIAAFFVSLYIIIGELVAESTLKLKPSGAI